MCLGMRRNVQALHISNHPRVLLTSQKPTSDALLCDVSVGPQADHNVAGNLARPSCATKTLRVPQCRSSSLIALSSRCTELWPSPTRAGVNMRRLEHLLLALIDDQDAAAAVRACNVDLEKLRRDLFTCIGSELDNW